MVFSVIIPIYNAEKSLDRCLESVKTQQLTDFEVIMVDDGSLDQSRQIAERFARLDPRFRYIRQNNSGVSAARNRGMSEAKADYITFLDSDDFYYPTYLAAFAELIEAYPSYGHYWCAYEEVDGSGTPKGRVYRCEREGEERIVLSGREHTMALHGSILISSPCNKVYRKTIVQTLQMRPSLSLGEDEVFNFEYLDKCPDTRIVILNDPQYGYTCVSQDSLNTKYRADLLDVYEELNQAEEPFIHKWGLCEAERMAFALAKHYRYERVLWNTFHEKNKMTRREKFRYANSILRSQAFRKCLRSAKGKINFLFYMGYRMRRFEFVCLVSKLAKRKQALGKRRGASI